MSVFMGKKLVIYKNELYENISKDSRDLWLTTPYSWLVKEPIYRKKITIDEVVQVKTYNQLIIWFFIKYSTLIGILLSVFGLLLNYYGVYK